MRISIWKGWGFVLVTALALFAILSSELRKRTAVEQALRLDVIQRTQAEKAEHELHNYAEAMRDSLVALTSTLDVNMVMSQILDRASNVVPYDGASILQFTETTAHVVFSRGYPPDAKNYVYNFSKVSPLPAHFAAIKEGQPYLINDTSQRADWAVFPFTGWVRATIGVPIVMRGGTILGVLAVDNAAADSYTNVDVERLQAFARYASLALENAYHTTQLEQRVAERTAELLLAKERTEAILNSSMDSILLVKPDLSIQQANFAFNQLFGCQPDAYLGCALNTIIYADDIAQVSNTIQQIVKERRGRHLESRMLRKNGTVFDAELSIGYIDNTNEQEHGLVCTIRDVSERKAYERQLRYHASLQENVTDAVISTDMEFRIQTWNRAAVTIYGWQPDEVLGKNIEHVLKTEFPSSATRERVRQEFMKEGHWTDEVIQHHRDGSPIHILSSTVLFKNEGGVPFGVVAVNHNISARKKMEEALRDALAQEKELSELKSRFISVASHEFRTPLATMLALTDTLTHYRHKMTDAQIDERYDKMREQIARLTEITQDVLHLTRLQAKKAEFNPVKTNLDALCRSIIEEFQTRTDVIHQLVYICPDPDCELLLDKKLMRHLLNNLLSNAIKYSPDGKTVTVNLVCADQHIVLSVRDEGIGIPEADLKRLFEPFHRAANVGGISGTGLGLVIAKESVELHNGTLTVDSQVGVGTTFTISIPRMVEVAPNPTANVSEV
ncbi:MAG: PAS domain S-box protein [Anaerolineae bacterium]|nr:PAS domain S-box protein [Anaerolineae bacterium]